MFKIQEYLKKYQLIENRSVSNAFTAYVHATPLVPTKLWRFYSPLSTIECILMLDLFFFPKSMWFKSFSNRHFCVNGTRNTTFRTYFFPTPIEAGPFILNTTAGLARLFLTISKIGRKSAGFRQNRCRPVTASRTGENISITALGFARKYNKIIDRRRRARPTCLFRQHVLVITLFLHVFVTLKKKKTLR